MVRQKSRWLLVRLDFEENLVPKSTQSSTTKRGRGGGIIKSAPESSVPAASKGISGKEIHKSLREMLSAAFGVVSAGMAFNIQVCIYDEEAQLAIVKVPRDQCNKVRASLTFLSSIESTPAVVSILAVCGSARTAKMTCLHELRHRYWQQEALQKSSGKSIRLSSSKLRREGDRERVKLDERMEKVRAIDG